MTQLLYWQLEHVLFYLLLLVRVLALLSVAPVIGSRSVPFRLRAMLSLFLTLVLVAGTPEPAVAVPGGMALFWAAIKEAMAGLSIGFLALLMFEAMQIAGEAMGVQIGFALADVVDPVTSENTALLGQLQYLFGTIVFMVIGGPMMVVKSLNTSLEIVPPGAVVLSAQPAEVIVAQFSGVLFAAVQFAAPVIICMLLVSIAMGIIGRTVPQFNILFVGIPIRTLLGLFIMIICMEYTVYRLIDLFDEIPGSLAKVALGMR
jgi:flagellar biosynthesis protein FliR